MKSSRSDQAMRLDGWKAIGAHFGRERSTVIRWAAERAMPVHRIPGAGRGSVYALTEELDAWLAADTSDVGEESTDTAAPAPVAQGFNRRSVLLPAALAVAVVSFSGYALTRQSAPAPLLELPADPDLADLYLSARSEWADRRPQSIASAITKLQQVVAKDPGFAPGYAALADSYVLTREFGSMDDVEAFARARSAADAALRIDPGNPDALRASGFVDYWWRGNRAEAARQFRAAIAAQPRSAQSHFWFGNVLIDNGDFESGLAALERARLLEPASVPLQIDIAWAHWSMGETDRARRELEIMRERHGDLATVRDYLAVIYLGEGDIAAFVKESAALAELRELPNELALVRRMQSALANDPGSVAPLVLRQLEAELTGGERQSLAWPVFVATAAGDRKAVLRLLDTGIERGETWGSAGLMRHVAQHWRKDRDITTRLGKLKPVSIAAG